MKTGMQKKSKSINSFYQVILMQIIATKRFRQLNGVSTLFFWLLLAADPGP